MATVKANTTLVIQPKNGATYDLTFGGITQYGRTSGDTIGVFPVDKEYTLVKHGDVEVYALDQFGVKSYEASELPDPAKLAPVVTVVVDGDLVVKDESGLKQLTSSGQITAEPISIPKRNRAAWRHFAQDEQQIGTASNVTYQMIVDVPKDTVGIQVILANASANAISTGMKVSCSPTETSLNLLGPVIGGELTASSFVQATFSGEVNPTIPAAPVPTTSGSSLVVPGYAVSDVIQFKSTVPTDSGLDGKGLAMFRVYFNTSGSPFTTMPNGINTEFPAVAGDRVTKMSNLNTGDFTASNPGFTPKLGTIRTIDGLIFHTLTKSYLVLSAGDSIMAGNGSATVDGHPAKLALLLRQDGKNVQNYNLSRGGLSSSAYMTRCKNLVASGVVPTHVMFPIHTRNDNGGTNSPTEAQITGRIAAAAEFASYVNSIGAIPIIIGPTPENSPTAGFAAAIPRLEDAGNKLAAASGGVYVSVMSTLGNQDYSWKSGLSSDAIHPNDAGASEMAALVHQAVINLFS